MDVTGIDPNERWYPGSLRCCQRSFGFNLAGLSTSFGESWRRVHSDRNLRADNLTDFREVDIRNEYLTAQENVLIERYRIAATAGYRCPTDEPVQTAHLPTT